MDFSLPSFFNTGAGAVHLLNCPTDIPPVTTEQILFLVVMWQLFNTWTTFNKGLQRQNPKTNSIIPTLQQLHSIPPPQKKTCQHPQIYPCPLYLNLLVRCKRNKWPKHISPSNDGFMVIYHEIESAKKQIQDEGLLKISQLIQLMKFHSKRTIAQIPLPQNL